MYTTITEYSILTVFITGSGSAMITGACCMFTQLVNLFFRGGLDGGTIEEETEVSPASSVRRRFFSGVDI